MATRICRVQFQDESGQSYEGYGAALDADLAYRKAKSELYERVATSHADYGPDSHWSVVDPPPFGMDPCEVSVYKGQQQMPLLASAAHPMPYRARVYALSEALERKSFTESWASRGPFFFISDVQQRVGGLRQVLSSVSHAGVRANILEFRNYGMLRSALCVLTRRSSEGAGIYCGVGTGVSLSVAVRRAVQESLVVMTEATQRLEDRRVSDWVRSHASLVSQTSPPAVRVLYYALGLGSQVLEWLLGSEPAPRDFDLAQSPWRLDPPLRATPLFLRYLPAPMDVGLEWRDLQGIQILTSARLEHAQLIEPSPIG